MSDMLARLSTELKAAAKQVRTEPNKDATPVTQTAHLAASLVLENLAKAIEKSLK
jgi:hypothetical protein